MSPVFGTKPPPRGLVASPPLRRPSGRNTSRKDAAVFLRVFFYGCKLFCPRGSSLPFFFQFPFFPLPRVYQPCAREPVWANRTFREFLGMRWRSSFLVVRAYAFPILFRWPLPFARFTKERKNFPWRTQVLLISAPPETGSCPFSPPAGFLSP